MQVLITGGSEGIGLGLATRFLNNGHRVLVTGRDAAKLERAAATHKGLETHVSDASAPEGRENLAAYLQTAMPHLDVIVNNAGIQRRISLAADTAPWSESQREIDTLLAGPIHLDHLLIPLILAHGGPAMIVNVTSGGAYVPQVFAPVYSACKAALHSYTVTLRHALAGTNCRVVELIPPAVRTALAGPGAAHGADLDEFCDTAFPQLFELDEVGFGPTKDIRKYSGEEIAKMFNASAGRNAVQTYAL